MGKKKITKKTSKKTSRGTGRSTTITPRPRSSGSASSAKLKALMKRRRFRSPAPDGSLTDGGLKALEGSTSTTTVVNIVVGECIGRCEPGCEWTEVANHYLEPDETICDTVSESTTSDGVVERKVIVKKPSGRNR